MRCFEKCLLEYVKMGTLNFCKSQAENLEISVYELRGRIRDFCLWFRRNDERLRRVQENMQERERMVAAAKEKQERERRQREEEEQQRRKQLAKKKAEEEARKAAKLKEQVRICNYAL